MGLRISALAAYKSPKLVAAVFEQRALSSLYERSSTGPLSDPTWDLFGSASGSSSLQEPRDAEDALSCYPVPCLEVPPQDSCHSCIQLCLSGAILHATSQSALRCVKGVTLTLSSAMLSALAIKLLPHP